jgi:hypothetical protein
MKHLTRLWLALAVWTIVAGLAVRAQGGPKDGLYLMTRYWSGTGLEIDAFYFKGTQVVRSPTENIEQFDFAAARRSAPGKVGQFTFAAGKLSIAWGDGTKGESPVETQAGDPCFTWDMGIFCPVEAFPAGAKLSGSFEGGASSGRGVSNARLITFAADGTYRMDSSAAVSSQTSQSRVTGGATGTESGTYQLAGTLLRLAPAGKTSYNVLVFPFTQNEAAKVKPDSLYFGGTMLKRKQ